MDNPSYSGNHSSSLDSGLSDVSPIPYYIWGAWSQDDVVSWVSRQATLTQFTQPVFSRFVIDGSYLQLLMSMDNKLFWNEIDLSEERKQFLCEELCRLLGPPMDTPPLTVPVPALAAYPVAPGARREKRVRFADKVDSRVYSPGEDMQQFHASPDLASQKLNKQVYLVKAASKLRVQLQQCYRCGPRHGLSKSDIDDYVLQYVFDGLEIAINDMVDDALAHAEEPVKVPPRPQFNETEKSLIAAFKGTWKRVAPGKGDSRRAILSWFSAALGRSGLSTWPAAGRRWAYVQHKLGLLDGSCGWVFARQGMATSSPYSQVSPLQENRAPFKNVSPIFLAKF